MFLLVCIVLLIRPDEASKGALEGLRVAFEMVLPQILPFGVCAQGLIYTGFCEKAAKLLKPFMRFIGINEGCSAPFVISLVAGYPSGCKAVCDMYKENMITKDEAEDFLSFCNNGGIIFALSICGKKAFGSVWAGVIIFLVQIVSSLVTAKLLIKKREDGDKGVRYKKIPPIEAMGKSIASGGSVIVNILSAFIVFYALGEALNLSKIPFLYGLWEMTKGIQIAGEWGSIPLVAFFFSFGGLSVFAQSASFSSEGELKLTKLFVGKIITASLALLITHLVLYIC